MNFKSTKFTHILFASQPVIQPAVRPRCTALEFLHNKVNHIKTVVLKHIYSLCHGASFYPLLLSFCLQIAYRKVRNLQISVDKLVRR